jgi:hypothetical protein
MYSPRFYAPVPPADFSNLLIRHFSMFIGLPVVLRR